MEAIQISNHPVYTDIKRKVKVNGIIISFADVISGEKIILTTEVLYFDANGNPFELAQTKWVQLVADKSKCVDLNGEIVECDSSDATMSEYDFYLSMMAKPIVINDLINSRVSWADSQGLFD